MCRVYVAQDRHCVGQAMGIHVLSTLVSRISFVWSRIQGLPFVFNEKSLTILVLTELTLDVSSVQYIELFSNGDASDSYTGGTGSDTCAYVSARREFRRKLAETLRKE